MKSKYQPVVCADGFRVSVQGNESACCSPRDDTGPYESVECGYPSHYDIHLYPYAEDADDPTGTVYGWVPAVVVKLCIDSHGGQVAGELPPFVPGYDTVTP